jgi:hypothetical protein
MCLRTGDDSGALFPATARERVPEPLALVRRASDQRVQLLLDVPDPAVLTYPSTEG